MYIVTFCCAICGYAAVKLDDKWGVINSEGKVIIKTFEELGELAKISPIPVVVGGGVKAADVPELKKCGLGGFFVISAVAGAEDPYKAAKELTDGWEK